MATNQSDIKYDRINEDSAEAPADATKPSRSGTDEGVGHRFGGNPIREAVVDELAAILAKQEVVFDSLNFGFGLEGFGDRLYAHPGLGPKLFWYGMCLGGYCSPFRCAKKVYLSLWIVAFLVCGGSCFYNLVRREVPYHLLAVDAMMALVHIPGLFSIIFWHSCFEVQEEETPGMERLVGIRQPGKAMWQVHTFVTHHGSLCLPSGQTVDQKLNAARAGLGLVLIPAQVALTALVYVGYALPAMRETTEEHAHQDIHSFAKFHGSVMCLAIPPVVACIVTSGALISYFIYLHILEADIVAWLIQANAVEELKHVRDPGAIRMIKWGDRNFYVGGADIASEKYANTVVSYIVEIFMHVQDRVDTSCRLWSSVVTQFLVVAFLELLSAVYDFSLMLDHEVKYSFTIPILCVDLFLLISGVIATTVFLILGASLTKRLDDLVVDVVVALRSRGVPPSISFSLYGFLESAGRKDGIGFKVFGTRITYSHVITYFSLLSTLLGFGIAHAEKLVEVQKYALDDPFQ
eukprot:TRINITY_DN54701_c0_g1_i1.p1 TRINITY_DN54701_c0_g1~~TRINITY_DN54701_c0_g1_i1.p1  ORF type:complete len:537 (+),score=66.39 TRINITY_DN54701_c0_g1_i1:54-1613(+)